MKTRILLLALVVLAACASCSSSNEEEKAVSDDGRRLCQLTVTPVDDAESTRTLFDLTRATLLPNGNTLGASWTEGDRMGCCNLSTIPPFPDIPVGTVELVAESTAQKSRFTGSLTCKNGDYIAVVYPKNTFENGDNCAEYTLPLTGQDGTLETIAQRYHLICGVTNVAVGEDNIASALISMKPLLTICRFAFVDDEGTPLSVQTLTSSYTKNGSGFNAGTYPQSASIVVSQSNAQESVVAEGVPGSDILSLNVSGKTEVYVALLPTGKRSFTFEVTTPDGKAYSGTASAKLNEGEFVIAPLKLSKNK